MSDGKLESDSEVIICGPKRVHVEVYVVGTSVVGDGAFGGRD